MPGVNEADPDGGESALIRVFCPVGGNEAAIGVAQVGAQSPGRAILSRPDGGEAKPFLIQLLPPLHKWGYRKTSSDTPFCVPN